MNIGVLALQGGFQKHIDVLHQLDVDSQAVRLPSDLNFIDGLILPGGESTTQTKLLHSSGLFTAIRSFGYKKPIFGTCAGSILMGESASDFDHETFGFVPVHIIRNAYGTQTDSFSGSFEFMNHQVRSLFIRAPKIEVSSDDVRVLSVLDQDPVVIQYRHYLMSTGHPELLDESAIHEYFCTMLK